MSKYKGVYNKIFVRHKRCGFSFYTTPYHLLTRKNRCPFCHINKDKLKWIQCNKDCVEIDFKNLNKETGDRYSLIKNCLNFIVIKYKPTNSIIKVQSKHFFNMLRKIRDRPIYKRISKKLRITTKQFKNKLKIKSNNQFELIGKLKDRRHKVKIKHLKCGHIFNVYPSVILQNMSCPYCRMTIGEYYVYKFLQKHNIKFSYGYRIHNTIYSKKRLHLDFYLPYYKIGIEFDGIEHFKPIKFFGGKKSFISLKKRDRYKNEYCYRNNIKLIRIEQTKVIAKNKIKRLVFKSLNTNLKNIIKNAE